jgi:hypothetical protein
MKKTSQLPKDDSLMENRDTLAYGEQSIDKFPGGKDDDMDEGSDEDAITMSDDDASLESDVEDDGTPVLTEEDLEENDLSEEEADDIEWDDSKSR